MENQQEEMNLSPEELTQRKEEMKRFFDDSIPYLESQSQYEKLLTDIEEARFKRATFQYQFAMMAQNTNSFPDAEGEEEDKDDFPVPPPTQNSGKKLKKS